MLTTAQVAARLGVKTGTVYAYVSRGVLTSARRPGGRGSLFDPEEVEALRASTTQTRRRPYGAVEAISTSIALLESDRLYYRGRDAAELAATHRFEEVAGWLWGEDAREETLDDGGRFDAPGDRIGACRAMLSALPPEARHVDRMRIVVAALAALDSERFDLDPHAIVAKARVSLATIAAVLDPLGGTGEQSEDESLALSLARACASGLGDSENRHAGCEVDDETVEIVDLALGLLADHDMAASTLAARVAASTRAHVYAVISAGLGAIDGRFHGAVNEAAFALVGAALEDPRAVKKEIDRGAVRLGGFGHRVYRRSDPRARALLERLRRTSDPRRAEVMDRIDAIELEVTRGTGLIPNSDFALAAAAHVLGLRPDTGETLFAFARIAGWVAHALEEYEEPGLRFRPEGLYSGPRPRAGASSE